MKYNWSAEGKAKALANLSKARGWNKGIPMTEEQRNKTSLAVRKAASEGRCKYRSSALEEWVDEVLQKNFPGEWAHVGVGNKVTIEGYIPDFININGKKVVIEAFGVYWHKPEEALARTETFAKYGYRTLVIWEKQAQGKERLPSEEEIVNQVRAFKE